MYSKKLLKYFKNPKNVGKIKDADAIGQAGNPMCGDIMRMYLKIRRDKKAEEGGGGERAVIEEAKFETLGCGAAIAMSSRVTELIKGKTVEEALELKPEDVARGFDLPKVKIHCSVLGIEALKDAIKNYQKNSNNSN